jgi:hypothetical protein
MMAGKGMSKTKGVILPEKKYKRPSEQA